MKLIFAQGNPDQKYTYTRHNVGWQILDAYAKKAGASFTEKPKFSAHIAEITVQGDKILLVKPTTYYNETGQSARSLVDFYKLNPEQDIIVIHDDLALPLGTLRVREQGRDAGNNGIKSLNSHLGEHYHRLRVGVSTNAREHIDDLNFVIGRFSSEEQQQLEKTIIPKSLEIIDDFIAGDHQVTSHTV